MIFVSHNHKDKVIVEQVALKLSDAFGQENVFYDSWSMQPGDGIVDKMNEGLGDCKLFLFFVSKNSLQSNMVKLEWQNAVMKAASGDTKIIPVKLDDCLMPPLLMQSIYIDLFGNGLDVAIRQIVDVASGRSTFNPGPQQFSNVRAYQYTEGDSTFIEIHAEHFLEPISNYMFLTDMDKTDVNFQYKSGNMCSTGFHENIRLNNGKTHNAQTIGIEKGTVPGFPFLVEVTSPTNKPVVIQGVLHEKKQNQWAPIPLANGKKSV